MKKFKLLSLTLSLTLLFTSIPVNANTSYADSTHEVIDVDTPITEDSNSNCDVYAELGSEFKVTIPKKVTLDGATKQGSYNVTVEGDIAGLEVINVTPDETVTLSSKDKSDVIGTITQDKTEWAYNEILSDNKVLGNGEIDANKITAGAWNGTFNFNINLTESNVQQDNLLTLSDDEVLMGSTGTVQVNAYIEGENVNDYVSWESNNENIIVNNGLVETTASAQVGDTATVTVTATSNASLFATDSEPLTATAQFTVTVIDMAYTTEGEDEVITSVNLEAGETKNIEVTIIPASVSGTVSWTTTAPAGINLVKNGNTVTVKIADDMAVGKTYDLVASYGNFSKLLTINIVAEEAHVHSYDAGVVTTEATCTTAGVRTYTCSCGNSYTEEISALGHKYNGNNCERCGIEAVAGLYDKNDNLLCTWEESGINVGIDYTYSTAQSSIRSPYYVLTNNYPTATKVVIPSSVTNIGECAFYKCTSLTSITIPSSVTSIKKHAFTDCKNLTSIIIPDSVTSIELCAFNGCSSLISIEIPDSVTNIDERLFINCTNLTNINVDTNNAYYCSVDGVLFDKNKTTLLAYPVGKTDIGYIIPNSVANIGNFAFSGCTNLTSVTIPNNVTSIGNYAFAYCKGLTSIIIPDSVTSIKQYTFTGCTNLTSVTIPNSITNIETGAFNQCTSLTSITIPSSVTSIKEYTFSNCTNLTSVTIPSSVTNIEAYAFVGCNRLTNATFKTTSGWYVGDSAGAKTTSINSSKLSNTSTAAKYLRETYHHKYWTR